MFVCLHETQHSAEGDTGQCPCISLGSRATRVLRDLSPNLGSCPLSCRGGTSGRGVVGETCPAEAAVSQTHPGLVSRLAGARGVAAFPGPAWASLHSSPAERLGLGEPGVSSLSQPRLLPSRHLSQLSAQALLGTHLAAAWNGVWEVLALHVLALLGEVQSAGAPVPTVARTIACVGGQSSASASPFCFCSWRAGV